MSLQRPFAQERNKRPERDGERAGDASRQSQAAIFFSMALSSQVIAEKNGMAFTLRHQSVRIRRTPSPCVLHPSRSRRRGQATDGVSKSLSLLLLRYGRGWAWASRRGQYPTDRSLHQSMNLTRRSARLSHGTPGQYTLFGPGSEEPRTPFQR
jgi:hypothetical protein